MKSQTKQNILIGVGIAILIALILLLSYCKSSGTIINSNTSTNYYSSTSSTTTPATTSSTSSSDNKDDDGWSFFNFFIPKSEPQCKIDTDCSNLCSNPNYAKCLNEKCSCSMPTQTEELTNQCSRNSDCSNVCSNPDNAACVNSKCSCAIPTSSSSRPVSSTELQCTINSDCSNLCANPNNAICSNNKCGCSAVTETFTCSDSDNNVRGGSGLNYGEKGSCQISGLRTTYTDTCYRGSLQEYHCSRDNCAVELVNCEMEYGAGYFCYDGMCVTIA